MKRFVLSAAAWGMLVPANLFAHSMWVVLQPAAGGKKMVSVWYADRLEPGRSSMLDRLTKLKISEAAAGTDRKPVEFVKVVTEDSGALMGAASSDQVTQVEAICEIGVRAVQTRPQGGGATGGNQVAEVSAPPATPEGDRQVSFAKYLRLDPKAGTNIPANPEMKLDIDPEWNDGSLSIVVYHNGAPEAARSVSITAPDGSRNRLETDEAGMVVLEDATSGRYLILARVEVNEPGELDGIPYSKITQDASLVLDIPSSAGSVD